MAMEDLPRHDDSEEWVAADEANHVVGVLGVLIEYSTSATIKQILEEACFAISDLVDYQDEEEEFDDETDQADEAAQAA